MPAIEKPASRPVPPPYQSPWTDARVELLRKMAADHVRCSRIAVALGGGITRNAVIGKLTRLGLSTGNGKSHHGPRMQRVPRKLKPITRAERMVAQRSARFDEMLNADQSVELPPHQSNCAMSFYESTANDNRCRYPLGDPQNLETFRYCGAKQFDGCSYCARHFRLTHHRERQITDADRARRGAMGLRSGYFGKRAR